MKLQAVANHPKANQSHDKACGATFPMPPIYCDIGESVTPPGVSSVPTETEQNSENGLHFMNLHHEYVVPEPMYFEKGFSERNLINIDTLELKDGANGEVQRTNETRYSVNPWNHSRESKDYNDYVGSMGGGESKHTRSGVSIVNLNHCLEHGQNSQRGRTTSRRGILLKKLIRQQRVLTRNETEEPRLVTELLPVSIRDDRASAHDWQTQ